MSKEFWAEAVNTACYLKNRSPTVAVQNKTPEEAWSGCKPDLSHLRIFGCSAYAHVPKQKRKKLDRKTRALVLVGYSEVQKGYRLFDPDTRDVNTFRDVVFDETVFPLKQTRDVSPQGSVSIELPFNLASDNSCAKALPPSDSASSEQESSEELNPSVTLVQCDTDDDESEFESADEDQDHRPMRNRKRPAHFDDYVLEVACAIGDGGEPKNFNKASKGKESQL